ncbi:MAG: response regulator [Pseudomonadota bacterium]
MTAPRLNVLLVDDNDDDNFVHRRVVEQIGVNARVSVFQQAQQALDYLRTTDRDPVDIVFLDISMPRMTGFEFMEAFDQLPRALRVGVVVIFLSASMNPADVDRALKTANARGFLNKPLSRAKFNDVVNEYFDVATAS